ncbi:carbon catabolite repressor protein 4-like protein 3 [Pyrus ussuriensis x Pyrus communis]|uniref:Carbon catabolite repressor protein 4-like protein 3 n=1 Tax=Pyrus ussuriensis x Pyrus communis TaxID=2448454 RepID=A0A5N5H0V3_9ROSA|nr:carbon catabolite repressor protein 4-like protein 3 [Pyrus ussuriensis x Pyrus communis]
MSRGGVGYDNDYADESYEILVSYRYSDGLVPTRVIDTVPVDVLQRIGKLADVVLGFVFVEPYVVLVAGCCNWRDIGWLVARVCASRDARRRVLQWKPRFSGFTVCWVFWAMGSDHLALVSEFVFELGTNEEKKETAASSSRTAFSKLQRRKLVGIPLLCIWTLNILRACRTAFDCVNSE